MSPFDVQLSGDLSTDHSDLRIAINEREKFRPVYGSENGLRGPGVAKSGLSWVISEAGEGRKVSNSDFILFGRGPESNTFPLTH
jgi:hypothetical protein